MLTVAQPSTYGYKSVHDLPTPPSTTRPSPPLMYQEPHQRPHSAALQSRSPTRHQSMSAPARGLPPPAAMAMPPQQHPPSSGPPSSHHHHQQQQQQQHHQSAPLSQPHQQPPPQWTSLPAPPQQWSGAEEPMRNWLQARAEEEKTRQEEEKTRQESLRLEQRRIEMEMLRASLGGGIPPPMVPLVFAGMGAGGVLPQAALEWAQQFTHPSQAHHLQQLMPGPRSYSPEHQRNPSSSAQGQYAAVNTMPGQAQSAGQYGPYPGSPTRPRGQTVSGPVGRPQGAGSNPPNLSTNAVQPTAQEQHSTANIPPYASHSHTQSQGNAQDASPSIYFHHWQPPNTHHGGSSTRPSSPSGEGSRKRKAMGPPQSQPSGSEQRPRSPPVFVQSEMSNASRRGHRRQKSDISWYRPPVQLDHAERSGRAHRGASPSRGSTPLRDRYEAEGKKHSVNSILSGESASGEVSRSHSQPRDKAAGSPRPQERAGGYWGSDDEASRRNHPGQPAGLVEPGRGNDRRRHSREEEL